MRPARDPTLFRTCAAPTPGPDSFRPPRSVEYASFFTPTTPFRTDMRFKVSCGLTRLRPSERNKLETGGGNPWSCGNRIVVAVLIETPRPFPTSTVHPVRFFSSVPVSFKSRFEPGTSRYTPSRQRYPYRNPEPNHNRETQCFQNSTALCLS